jgi:NADPH:quinone reductase-like Zn-dependent oxidoreductase
MSCTHTVPALAVIAHRSTYHLTYTNEARNLRSLGTSPSNIRSTAQAHAASTTMNVVPWKGRVCVTGGSGFLGSWIVKLLLERGYVVHATTRRMEKAGFLNGHGGFEPSDSI